MERKWMYFKSKKLPNITLYKAPTAQIAPCKAIAKGEKRKNQEAGQMSYLPSAPRAGALCRSLGVARAAGGGVLLLDLLGTGL